MLTKLSENRCFQGRQLRYQHYSEVLKCEMKFSVFLPPDADIASVPVLYWLSGLTCTDENFVFKAGAQRMASELGLAILCPDTSPRGLGLPGEDDDWDFGSGAGFYLNATQSPWNQNYRMYDYVVTELPAVTETFLPLDGQRRSISGHSMGGHGALVCGLRNPGRYHSISALSPIVAPSSCPWGEKAFSHYLGKDRKVWRQYDACQLIPEADEHLPLLVDQGLSDPFLEQELRPHLLEQACEEHGYPLVLRLQEGYDHSYFFIASFIEDHLHFHARHLNFG
ncbi:MAG: S-formylglutathione hydrolase [Motiliproteus sp.]|nr:S-formylglutathione hydrolase [Motiliproteus sp.]MCW9052763.1 S-formylglutathione hydrolase [Motiliproteus sp.]